MQCLSLFCTTYTKTKHLTITAFCTKKLSCRRYLCILLYHVCRPWYVSAATYPKDLVMMIDNSQSMNDVFGGKSRLYCAIKAAQSVIDTLNPNDHVSISHNSATFE